METRYRFPTKHSPPPPSFNTHRMASSPSPTRKASPPPSTRAGGR